MNPLHEIERLRREWNCFKKSYFTIIKLGDDLPDQTKTDTLQVRNNGDQYFVDHFGQMVKLTAVTTGGGTGGGTTPPPVTNMAPIEVEVGTPAATTLGFLAGGTTLASPDFAGKYLEIYIGNVNLYSIPKTAPIPYFIKDLGDSIAQLYNVVLEVGDTIKVKQI